MLPIKYNGDKPNSILTMRKDMNHHVQCCSTGADCCCMRLPNDAIYRIGICAV